jgi:hypothetical protein
LFEICHAAYLLSKNKNGMMIKILRLLLAKKKRRDRKRVNKMQFYRVMK